jgi:hypothetical protein
MALRLFGAVGEVRFKGFDEAVDGDTSCVRCVIQEELYSKVGTKSAYLKHTGSTKFFLSPCPQWWLSHHIRDVFSYISEHD